MKPGDIIETQEAYDALPWGSPGLRVYRCWPVSSHPDVLYAGATKREWCSPNPRRHLKLVSLPEFDSLKDAPPGRYRCNDGGPVVVNREGYWDVFNLDHSWSFCEESVDRIQNRPRAGIYAPFYWVAPLGGWEAEAEEKPWESKLNESYTDGYYLSLGRAGVRPEGCDPLYVQVRGGRFRYSSADSWAWASWRVMVDFPLSHIYRRLDGDPFSAPVEAADKKKDKKKPKPKPKPRPTYSEIKEFGGVPTKEAYAHLMAEEDEPPAQETGLHPLNLWTISSETRKKLRNPY